MNTGAPYPPPSGDNAASAADHARGVMGVLAASVLWGTTGVSASFAPEVSAVAIGAAAMGIGGLLQAALAARGIARHAHALWQQKMFLLLGALAVAVYPLAFYASMRLAGVTIGTVVSIGSAPLLSALIELVMDKARLGARWAMGAVFGIAGIALLCLAETGHGGEATAATAATATATAVTGQSQMQTLFGIGLGLLAGLTYAFYSWAARRIMQQRVPSRPVMGAMFGLGGLLLMPVLLATGAPLLASWNNAAVGIYMALGPMFLGYLCFGYGLARVAASTATTITLIEPVVAAVLAVVIVGERLPLVGWLGVALIIVCLLCITLPQDRQRALGRPKSH